MAPMNSSYEAASGEGVAEFVRLIALCVRLVFSDHPVIGIAAGILLICLVIIVVLRMARRDRPSKRVAGTAEVLSVDTMATTEGSDPSSTCRIVLRVHIPGRAPFDATTSNGEFLTAAEVGAVQPGKTVTVLVDSTDPQDVWIDFSSIT
jgi:hypothetical protein